MLRIFRKAPDREPRVGQLFDSFVTEGEIWDALSSFAPFSQPASVAICETSFAHIGMMQHVCMTARRAGEAGEIASAIGNIVERGFPSGDEDTAAFYRSLLLEDVPLGRAGRLSVAAYCRRAFRPEEVALILCGRIGCRRDRMPMIESRLKEFAGRVDSALKARIAA